MKTVKAILLVTIGIASHALCMENNKPKPESEINNSDWFRGIKKTDTSQPAPQPGAGESGWFRVLDNNTNNQKQKPDPKKKGWFRDTDQ